MGALYHNHTFTVSKAYSFKNYEILKN